MRSNADEPTRTLAGIGDVIIVSVRDLKSLVLRGSCLSADETPVLGCNPQKIVLYLDGREIKDLYPESGAPELAKRDGNLKFHIQRSLKSDEAWADLLGSPRLGPEFFLRPTRLSVGYENGFALPTVVTESRFALVRIRQTQFWIAVVALGFLVAFMVRLAQRTNLLRDLGPSYSTITLPAPSGTAGRSPAVNLKPYSLARCQMAFWFVLTVAAFAFIYLITGASDTITSSVLALIGISAGTFLGAAVIDASAGTGTPAVVETKVSELVSDMSTLETQRASVEQQATDLSKQIGSTTAGPAKIALEAQRGAIDLARQTVLVQQDAVRESLDAFPSVVAPHATRHFLTDVLGDVTGPSFHRFQIFVWTIVLGVLFVMGVWSRLSMPEFSATLLGLMGISSGTYLGFKFPEAKA